MKKFFSVIAATIVIAGWYAICYFGGRLVGAGAGRLVVDAWSGESEVN